MGFELEASHIRIHAVAVKVPVNTLLGTDTQHQAAALRQVLRAGQRQR